MVRIKSVFRTFDLRDCLFGTFMLTKDIDPEKYRYNGYGIGLDARSGFSLQNGEWGKNINFGVDKSLSSHRLDYISNSSG